MTASVYGWLIFITAVWLVPLAAFSAMKPWLLRTRTRAVVAALLCFTPAIGVMLYPNAIMTIAPLGVAIPSWLRGGLRESSDWREVLNILVVHLPIILLVGGVAFLVVGRHLIRDAGGQAVLRNPLSLGMLRQAAASTMGRGTSTGMKIYSISLFLMLPAAMMVANFIPWDQTPSGRFVPLSITAVFLFLCAVLAHWSTSVIMGRPGPESRALRRFVVALLVFLLLRSFVAMAVFRINDLSYHFAIG